MTEFVTLPEPSDRNDSKSRGWVNPHLPKAAVQRPFSPEAHGYHKIKGTPDPPPLKRPPFTLQDVRDAVPPHCFERSLIKSLKYAFHNVAVCAVLFYGATRIEDLPVPLLLHWAIWPTYWFAQGAYMVGLGVLAHECGHDAFSEYPLVNDFFGLILHTFVLVPYHSFKFSHRKHHINTGSAENEEMYVPHTRSRVEPQWCEILEESLLYNLARILAMLFLGFLPFYLVFNFGGPLKYKGMNANHFSPSAVIFLPKQRREVIISDIVYITWIATLVFLCYTYSFTNVFFYYGAPMLVNNCYLVVITFLQHTDTFVPHFRGEDWYWLRGALCTVDRSFGSWLDGVFHHLPDTHVCHHLFPKLPFYHAQEATEAIRKVLGSYRLRDSTPMWTALWRAYLNCKFVEDKGPVVFYKRNPRNGYL